MLRCKLQGASHPVVHPNILPQLEAEAPLLWPCLDECPCVGNAPALCKDNDGGVIVYPKDGPTQVQPGTLHMWQGRQGLATSALHCSGTYGLCRRGLVHNIYCALLCTTLSSPHVGFAAEVLNSTISLPDLSKEGHEVTAGMPDTTEPDSFHILQCSLLKETCRLDNLADYSMMGALDDKP